MINEAAPLGQTITTVTASDADSDENGRVTYELQGGDRHAQFAVHPDTGVVSVASMLDREMVSAYVLEVRIIFMLLHHLKLTNLFLPDHCQRPRPT